MKKIRWQHRGAGKYATAKIGTVCMSASISYYITGKERWQGYVYFEGLTRTMRYGEIRKTIILAKEDAERMAKEILEDFQVSLTQQMRQLGMDIEVESEED